MISIDTLYPANLEVSRMSLNDRSVIEAYWRWSQLYPLANVPREPACEVDKRRMRIIIRIIRELESVDRDEYQALRPQREGVVGWKLLWPNGWENPPGVSFLNRATSRREAGESMKLRAGPLSP